MRKAIWKAMLDADMNERYWRCLSARYVEREQYLKIFMALMASGTVAGWGVWADTPFLWKTLSALSALLAVSLPFLNYHKLIEQVVELAGKWGELRIEYEDLWTQNESGAPQNALETTFKRVRKIESTLPPKEAKIREDKKLLTRCVQEVLKARGI